VSDKGHVVRQLAAAAGVTGVDDALVALDDEAERLEECPEHGVRLKAVTTAVPLKHPDDEAVEIERPIFAELDGKILVGDLRDERAVDHAQAVLGGGGHGAQPDPTEQSLTCEEGESMGSSGRVAHFRTSVRLAVFRRRVRCVPRRRVVIDHLTLGVNDLARSREFYVRALVPLGFAEISVWRDDAHQVAFGLEEADDFTISTAYDTAAPVHVAFAADRREQVDAFYSEALIAGGRDNGPPGLRPQYSSEYYAAFVLDPDGNNVEAVHHGRA
jgi:catechol 2,3-dioxygenase-like lactoylglutathione lyase family enzyme